MREIGRYFEPSDGVEPMPDSLIYPGNGYPPNVGEARPGLSPFGRLAKGQPLGKSVILIYNAALDEQQFGQSEIMRLEGDDLDSTQLHITLAAPRVQWVAFAAIPDDVGSAASMTFSNAEVSAANFPGTDSPIIWPAFQAIIEWGTRGSQALCVADLVNGFTLNVTASFVRVTPMIAQGASVGAPGTSAAYEIRGSMGPGFTTGNALLRNTVYVGTVAGDSGESNVFSVPPFASKATVVGLTNLGAATGAYLNFFRDPAGANGAGSYFQSGNQPQGFAVPTGGMYFTITNTGSEGPFAVVFELAI
jgi:hypothetical protein